MSITSMSARAGMAQKLSIPQLQQAIQDGVIPPYVGIPLLQEKVKMAKTAQASQAAQMGEQPSVAQQVMQQAQQVEQGVPALQSNLPASMAGGGIVAFAEGGMYDDEEDSYDDRIDAARQAEMDDLMNEYVQTFQGGIGQLPAAEEAKSVAASSTSKSPSREENGIAGGDAADFVARIMHKESRGRRYGKDGELLTSEKGAKGEMQVMPGTSRDPGFGVTPARDNSPDELARVGRDYANTMLQRYGDPKLAAIAYNMGPGATDKWLAAGADMSKLPKETQGYVKGFAEGGLTDDYTTIEGMEPSDLYAEAIKRARAARIKEAAAAEEPTTGRGLWPYNAPEAGKFSYEDAAKFDARKKDEEPAALPKGNAGITYAPNTGMGNVTPTRYVPKESNERESEMMRAVKTPFRAAGAGLASLYGGKAGMPSDTDYTASGDLSGAIMGERTGPAPKVNAAAVQNIPNISRGRSTMANDPRLIGAPVEVAQDDGLSRDAGLNARIDKMLKPSATATSAAEAAAKPDPYAEFRELFAKREANLAKQREQDKYMALLQAGLGIMGGTSQHALANIGAGATQGIQSLAQSNAARTAEENALLSGRLGLAKIGGAKEQADAMMQLRRDLQKDVLSQRGEQAKATEAGRTEAREIRVDAKQVDYIKNAKENALTQATKLVNSGTAAMTMTDDQKAEAVQNIANKLLMNDGLYRGYVKNQHGKDPFEGFGKLGGGGTMSPERAGQFKVER
jgi:soluble lytic murein transglycosylase-like protein